MDQNNRNNRNRGDKNRRRGGGMWSIVLWALLLTIGVNYVSVMLEQARAAESSCEIAHSELVDLVEFHLTFLIFPCKLYTCTIVQCFLPKTLCYFLWKGGIFHRLQRSHIPCAKPSVI